MLSPCRITTRPFESVIQRPAWESGGVGPAAIAGALATPRKRRTRSPAHAAAPERDAAAAIVRELISRRRPLKRREAASLYDISTARADRENRRGIAQSAL